MAVGQGVRSVRGSVWLAVFLLLPILGACDLIGTDHLQQGQAYLDKGQYQAAVIEFKNVLQGDPGNLNVRRTLGEIYLKMGNGQSAEKELRKVAEKSPDDQALKLEYVRALLLNQEFDKALQYLSALKGLPVEMGLDALRLQGDTLLRLQKTGQAKALYRQVLDARPGNPQASLGLARVLAVERDFDVAEALVKQINRQDPANIEAWLFSGRLALAQQRPQAALRAYQSAWGSGTDINVNRRIQARFGIVTALLALGKSESALQHVDALLTVLPNHPMLHYWRARLYYAKADYTVARDELLQVMRVAPKHAPSLLLLGSVYYAQGELAQAEHYLQQYVAMNSDDLRGRKLLAATRLRLRTPGDALAALDPVMSQADKDPQLLAMAGSAALRSGDFKKGAAYLRDALSADPGNSAMRTELGLAYLVQGQTKTAIKALLGPDTDVDGGVAQGRRQFLLAVAYARNKEFSQAHAVVKAMLNGKAGDKVAYNLDGMVSWREGHLEEADLAFSKAIKEDGKYAPALLNKARLNHQRGKLATASQLYDLLLAVDGNNISGLLGRAQIAVQMKDEKGALTWLRKAREVDASALQPRIIIGRYALRQKDMDEARQMERELVAIAPDHPEVLVFRAELAQAAGEHKAALRFIRTLVQKTPKDPVAYFRLGSLLLADKQYSGARQALKQAIVLNRDYLVARELLARIDIQLGNTKTARNAIREIRKSPENQLMADILDGDLQLKSGHPDKALRSYRAALKRNPDHRLAMLRVYLTRKRAKDKLAYQGLDAWLERHPDDFQVRMMIASDYMLALEYGKAVQQYEQVVESGAENPIVFNNLGWIYEQQGDPRAIETAKKAYDLRPDKGPILDTYGWMLVNHDRAAEGLRLLLRADQLVPNNSDIRYHLAMAYVKSGQSESAQKILRWMRSSGHDVAHVAELTRLLKE